MTAPDPAAVMAEHHVMPQSVSPWNQRDALCATCSNGDPVPWPCEPYRLAEALERTQGHLAAQYDSLLRATMRAQNAEEALAAHLKAIGELRDDILSQPVVYPPRYVAQVLTTILGNQP